MVQKEVMLEIYNQLADKDWSLDDICVESKGGFIAVLDWQSYGFKLGILAKIRGRISEFKRQRSSNTLSDSITDNSKS